MKSRIEVSRDIPNIRELEAYLNWMRLGFVFAHRKLLECTNSELCSEVEMYAYHNGYTFRERNGKLGLNPWKKV